MSMSFSVESTSLFNLPITALEYSDMAVQLMSDAIDGHAPESRSSGPDINRPIGIELSEEELAERIKRERADATLQVEQRLRQEYEAKLQVARASVGTAITKFEAQQSEYYARAQAEIVQLALSIAAKILHREAQVDPTLVAALVKMTLEKMHEGSSVTVRVSPSRAKRWKEYFAGQSNAERIQVVEDPALSEQDCMLETELGVANFGLDTQLKEIEKGFFDLMALRPESR